MTRTHNRLQHDALMGGADPNEAYEEDQKNLAFELREEAGKKMAQQNAVVTKNQQNMQKEGHSEHTLGAMIYVEGATGRNILDA